jgi:hypothetical protein
MAEHEPESGDGRNDREAALRKIENGADDLIHAGVWEAALAEARPGHPESLQHKALGENFLTTADEIKARIKLLKQIVEQILQPPTGQS